LSMENDNKTVEYESKLIPILRQGVAVIQMIFFKKLRDYLHGQYPDYETTYHSRLSGAIVNDLFGTPNEEEPFASFAKENSDRIDEELKNIPIEFADMLIPLTDALRVQFLCDKQEGIDSSSVLTRANELNVLLIHQQIPLPAHFMNLVREMGAKYDLLVPQEFTEH
jgi:hypothetical protein